MIENNKKIVQNIINYEPQVKKIPNNITDINLFMNQHEDLVARLAMIREQAYRLLGLKAYPVQMLGVLNLINNKIIEMKTGEGKTLVAAIAATYLGFLDHHVQIITVNDYLAKRDLENNQPLFNNFGLSSAVITNNSDNVSRKVGYATNVCYLTAAQAGFDYLKDNLQVSPFYQNQIRDIAIIDEVDSILLDDSLTPLIIASSSNFKQTEKFKIADNFVQTLNSNTDVLIDREHRTASLTESGSQKISRLYGVQNINEVKNKDMLYFINKALQANYLYSKNKDYILSKAGRIELLDATTNRVAEGRSYEDGLQQALQAKEGVEILPDNQSISSITYAGLFNLYQNFAGMTGTAWTSRKEFKTIYHKDVVQIPTNKPTQRKALPDRLFLTQQAKEKAVLDTVQTAHASGQPILLGTLSVELAEHYSQLLDNINIQHTLLTAKNDAKEAEIIAKAGQKGAVTVATNMAGRGTDIKLGPGVNELGGLFVLVTERSASQRIDNQFAGRTGRQGEKGIIQFYISYQDEMLSIFLNRNAREQFINLMKEDASDNQEITSSRLKKYIRIAQQRREGQSFDQRKDTNNYDEINARQRNAFYESRQNVLNSSTIEPLVDFASVFFTNYQNLHKLESVKGLQLNLSDKDPQKVVQKFMQLQQSDCYSAILDFINQYYDIDGDNNIKSILLNKFDQLWKQELEQLDMLHQQVLLVSYKQEQPIVVYAQRALDKFEQFKTQIALNIADSVLSAQAAWYKQKNNPSKNNRS